MPFSYDYDTTYPGPALPVVDLIVRNVAETNNSMELSAMVDSGADGTMIPLRTLQRLKARKVDQKRMRGVSGILFQVSVYEVAIQLGNHVIPKVYAIADRQNQQTILGRDVLNQFVVTLNGLAHVVEISQ
jgi:predicted aspartyl protease